MWGEDHDLKTEKFNAEVKLIEDKHAHIFANQINLITGKSPDRLAFQFMTTYDGRTHTCGFRKETYVPVNIQEEVYDAFKSIFSEQ